MQSFNVRDILTTAEVAKYLRCSLKRASSFMWEPDFPLVNPDAKGARTVVRQHLDEWLDRRKEERLGVHRKVDSVADAAARRKADLHRGW